MIRKIKQVLDVFFRVSFALYFLALGLFLSLLTFMAVYSLQPALNSAMAYTAGFLLAFAAFFVSYARGLEGEHTKEIHRRGGYIAVGSMVLAMAALFSAVMLVAEKGKDNPAISAVMPTFFMLSIYVDGVFIFTGLVVAINNLYFVAHYLCFGHRAGYKFSNSIFVLEHFAKGFLETIGWKSLNPVGPILGNTTEPVRTL